MSPRRRAKTAVSTFPFTFYPPSAVFMFDSHSLQQSGVQDGTSWANRLSRNICGGTCISLDSKRRFLKDGGLTLGCLLSMFSGVVDFWLFNCIQSLYEVIIDYYAFVVVFTCFIINEPLVVSWIALWGMKKYIYLKWTMSPRRMGAGGRPCDGTLRRMSPPS